MYRVGVVGFGVAGAAVAYLLARDGHRVTLLERAPELGPVGAGILLQCSGQEVLRRPRRSRSRSRARGAARRTVRPTLSRRRMLVNNRYPELSPEIRAYGVHRGVIFTALFDLVKSQPVDVRPACEIVSRETKPMA